MTTQNDLETLYKAVDTHWPYEDPHIEYSTDGYLYFRQNGSVIAIAFPIKSLMSKRSKSAMTEEMFIETEEIESFFREYMPVLIAQIKTEGSVKKEMVDAGYVVPTVDEGKDKFVYPEGISKSMADKRKKATE